MLPEYFAVIGAVVASVGGFMYFLDTLKGKVKPNRVTWLLWGVLPMITFIAQRAQGVAGVSWATFVAGLLPLLIFGASLVNKKAYWETKPVDYACMVIALVGIGLWALTKTPNLAIFFSIVADFAAGLPTFIKAYKHPETESWSPYAVSAGGFVVSILAIHEWTFANYSFVVYLVVLNGVLSAFAFRGRKRKQVAVA